MTDKVKAISGNCRVSVFFDFERPPFNVQDSWQWGDPVSRALDRLCASHEGICESSEHVCGTWVVFEYEELSQLILHAEEDRKWAQVEFERLLAEEIIEEARLVKDREYREEAEELDFLIDQALGA